MQDRTRKSKIREARRKLKASAKGYKIKSYIVLGMMLILLGAAFALFYFAGDIVSEETKKIIPLIDSTQKKQTPAIKKVTAKIP